MKNKPLILFIMVFTYIAIFSYTAIRQHNAYNTTLFDLGIFDQVVWNTAHGRLFESSIKGFNFLGDHFSPILVLAAPLYYIWSDARMLLILQTLLLAIGVFPIYLIARREFKENSIALLFAFIYLAYPALGYLNMFDFHPIAISVPFLAWAFYFFKTDRWGPFYSCITGALLCKEEIAIIVAFFGIFIWIKTRNFKKGIPVFGLGLFYFILIMFFIIPEFGKGQFLYYVRYSHLGANIREIAKTIVFHPIYSLACSFTLKKLANFAFIFLALGFAPFFSPLHLLPVLPTLAYSYLSNYPLQFDVRYQYTAPMIPFLVFAAMYGTKNILGWLQKDIWKKIFLYFLLFCTICASLCQIIVPLRKKPLTPRAAHLEIIQAARLIPKNSSLTAGNSLGAHFSQRQFIKKYSIEETPSTELVFLDLNRDFAWSEDKESFNESFIRVLNNKNYGVLYFDNAIVLLKKGIRNDKSGEVLSFLANYQSLNLPQDSRFISFIKKMFKTGAQNFSQ